MSFLLGLLIGTIAGPFAWAGLKLGYRKLFKKETDDYSTGTDDYQ